jgi:hypothetical protein
MLNKMSHTQFQDVHQYDGKITIPDLPQTYSTEEKLEQIKILLPKLKRTKSMQMMQLIIKALVENTQDNYDDINKVDASDILAAILSKPYDNLLDIMEEQLEDIWELGRCPQGRTIRFIQMYRSIETIENDSLN